MPIIVRDYEVTQTSTSVVVTVPLRGVHPSRATADCSDVYIKANFPPFFFELDLAQRIEDEASSASIGNGIIQFKLVKAEPGEWANIRFEAPPAQLRERRKDAEARAIERQNKRREQLRIARREQEHDLVRQQIEVERAKRERVEANKRAESDAAAKQVNSWAASVEKKDTSMRYDDVYHRELAGGDGSTVSKITEIVDEDDVESDNVVQSGSSKPVTGHNSKMHLASEHDKEPLSSRMDSAIFTKEDAVVIIGGKGDMDPADDLDAEQYAFNSMDRAVNSAEPNASCQDDESDDDIDVEAIRARVRAKLKIRESPSPRSTGEINVVFTSRRGIPTQTARETEDQKWHLRIKLAEAVHKANQKKLAQGVADSNHDGDREDDRNTELLKDKGMEFYKQGNIQAALNAFSSAIDLDGINASLYANRAACHLQLSDAESCIADCTTALSLIEQEERILSEGLVEPETAGTAVTGTSAVPGTVANPVEARRAMRTKLLARQGAARANISGDLHAALKDFKAAIELQPLDQELRKDAERVAERLGVTLD